MTIRKHLRVAHNMTGGLGSIEVKCVHYLSRIAIASFQHHVRHTCFARTRRTNGLVENSSSLNTSDDGKLQSSESWQNVDIQFLQPLVYIQYFANNIHLQNLLTKCS